MDERRPIAPLPRHCPHSGVDVVLLCRHTGVPAAGARGSAPTCPVHGPRSDCLACSRCLVERIRDRADGARVTLAA